MTLQQLRYFREVVRRDLNISKAAAALHITQPGLSRQMRLLEEELGIELFVR
ncbi:MAG TPA: LysR family transcriptional regulator, partial [Burkholderiales bacterium]|nr:LysR family transcriptional regulator [Burkholderiales bacterium]